MNKFKFTLLTVSCATFLTACSSSSGGADNSEQIRQSETTLTKKLVELNKKTAEEQKAREETEKRLKELENGSADEKARIPVSDQIFGGRTGVMTDLISGAVIENSTIGRPLSHDISELAVVNGKEIIRIPSIIKTAGELDPWTYEEYEDPYNLRKDGQTIQSNSNLKSTAFGVHVDNYTGKQYLYVQGNPTDVKQIPTAGKAEYLGGAVYLKDGANNERAKMTATADFDKKTVAIKIDQNRNAVPEMNFGGKITGNSFAGEVNGVKTQGGFFGENAKELSGVFTNDADKSRGVFGAIKQDAAQ